MHKVFLGTACFLFSALSLHAQSPLEKGLQSINRTSAEAIVEFLADDELQGHHKIYGSVAQLVRVPACHAGGRGFEPLLSRHFNLILKS